MHPIQSQLYADHFNFLRLLAFLEGEIACYEADNGGHARLPIVLDILDYIQAYPERWHHPMEDAAFELLLVKQVPKSEQIWSLKSEHKKLESLTDRAVELFSSVANDVVVPVEELLSATREFIHRQQEHINKENLLVYPLLSEFLTDDDWEMLELKVQGKIDPLFATTDDALSGERAVESAHSHLLDKDRALKAEYRNLYKLIMQSERGISIGITARGKANGKNSSEQNQVTA